MMTDHFENEVVYYKMCNTRHTKSDKYVSIAVNSEKERNEKKEKIKKVYPFSVFATDPMI